MPPSIKTKKLPKLPKLLERKLYKTGQTRGADDDDIFQNRVSRNSTVLIPYPFYDQAIASLPAGEQFESGFIVLISPTQYFGNAHIESELARKGLKLGKNLLVLYETRSQWNSHAVNNIGWSSAKSRTEPLKGQYVARVPATTASAEGKKIVRGFDSTTNKGAGIRVYEYASALTIKKCRIQLEALFWLCRDSVAVSVSNGMSKDDSESRRSAILSFANEEGLLEKNKLHNSRIINDKDCTVCPLCLEELSGDGFFSKMEQAEGREIPDLTVTQINLFHVEELRIGLLNHRPYNVGWGHHHCNVVVKDSGIKKALTWMSSVLERNYKAGYFTNKAC